jgi:Sulfotransferase domain
MKNETLRKFLHPLLFRTAGLWVLNSFRAPRIIVVGSALRVGSTWLYSMVRDISGLHRLPIPRMFRSARPLRIPLDELILNFHPSRGSFIHKSHAHPPGEEFLSALSSNIDIKFLTMIRDPRDMLVSLSFFFVKNAREGSQWKHFPELSPKERILQLIESENSSRDLLREWYQCPFAYKVKYEDLLAHGEEQMEGVLRFLGYDYRPKVIADYCRKHSFKNMSGRKAGTEAAKSSYRKGISGDWRQYFDEECRRAFKTGANGEWQKLLVLLGYEKDGNW